jgi:hypothetical protein
VLNSKIRNAAVVAAVSIMLSACGGGGGGGTPAPVITTQPVSASVLTGGAAIFSVSATGDGLRYQWKKNGVDIAGATAATYTTPAATYVDAGTQYSVVVSDAGGSVTSTPAQLTLALSANQQAFEDVILAPKTGSYELHWNLNSSGPEATGTNYAFSDNLVITASPLTKGPQTGQQSAPQNLTTTLAVVTPGPTRILKDGAILVVPNVQAPSKVSYVGSDVQIDSLASDNSTVGFSTIRSNYETVSLTGTMSSTAPDFAHWYNSFFTNPAILNAAAPWGAGASYVKYTQTSLGDRYQAVDCSATTTTDANIIPCFTGTTLTSALTTGITSGSDGTTYHLADGTVSTVGGVKVFVATAARPQSATLSTTVQYRIYFEMNGNVYTGILIKDGTVMGGSYYISNPGGATVTDRLTFLPFQVRMNKAAHDSLAAAMAI